MIRILFIAQSDSTTVLDSELVTADAVQLVRKASLIEAESLLQAGVFDVIILAATPPSALTDDLVRARQVAPDLPLLVVAAHWELPEQERTMAQGAAACLLAPLGLVTLQAALRPWRRNPAPHTASSFAAPVSAIPQPAPRGISALEVLRDFSKVLGYSLDYKQFSQQFVERLRDILSINRIAIFLQPPPTEAETAGARPADQRLRCAAAIGINQEILSCFELSRRSGIGQVIVQDGQILRRSAAQGAAEREFGVLNCQIALPINDRERTLGVAVVGGPITGGSLSDAEIPLVCHLLEELGVAVKNSWLHRELRASHHLLDDVLGAIRNGCLVIGADLRVQHANRAMREFLLGDEAGSHQAAIDFAQLPIGLSSALHRAVENRQSVPPFFLPSPARPERRFRISILPFLTDAGGTQAQPVIAVVEDWTQIQAAQNAEIEASNFKLMALIARRFAHEIRNSLVPLTTHHQLFDTDVGEADFRASLKQALGQETRRIQRFTEQMLFLSQPANPTLREVSVRGLVEEAFARAGTVLGITGELTVEAETTDLKLTVHPASFKHALEEIFLNALQASPEHRVRVILSTVEQPNGILARLAIRDEGGGFAEEVAQRAVEPFFTTRNTGVGLGLTVARRIVLQHHGELRVQARNNSADSDVLMEFPMAPR